MSIPHQQTIVYKLWGYSPDSENMILFYGPPLFRNSRLGFINPGLILLQPKDPDRERRLGAVRQTIAACDAGGYCLDGQEIRLTSIKDALVSRLEPISFWHILGIMIPTDSYFSEGLKPPTSVGSWFHHVFFPN